MLGVFENFCDLPTRMRDDAVVHPLADFTPGDEVAQHAVEHAERCGLTYKGRGSGRHMLVGGDGAPERKLQRQHLYAVTHASTVLAAARELASAIAIRNGPGDWWSTGPAVGYVGRCEGTARCCEIDGVTHVLLAAYYFHDPAGKPTQVSTDGGVLRIGDDVQRKIDELEARRIEALEATRRFTPRVWPHPPKPVPMTEPPRARSMHNFAPPASPTDPLDVTHDGVTLRALLDGDEFNRQERGGTVWRAKAMTPAELRAKVAAAKERDRRQVTVDMGDD